jgi:ElaB/YqjD/DUF883 family membrane-anchored ribosome-binding protein
MTNDTNESPEDIKTDIERTRQDMSDKIEQIQARLSPTNIKTQAQETVRELMRDSTDSLSTYFSENSKEIGASMVQIIKNNPIPAALIGLGVGWLLVENYTGSSSNQRYGRQSNDWQRDQYSDQYNTQYRSQYGGQYSNQYSSREMTPSFASQYQGPGSQPYSAGGQYGSGQGSTGGYSSYTSGDQPGWMSEQGSNLREKIGEKAEQLRETAQHVGEQVSEKVEEWTDRIRSQSNAVGQQADYYSDQAQGRMANMGEQAAYMGEQAQAYMQQTGQQLQRTLEDNPLVFGGVALAVGALIGMALPVTRREQEMLGPWRDQVIHSAQEVASDVAERVQQVAEDVRPQLEQTAQKVVSDLKQTGREALEEVKQTSRTALDETKQAGKEIVDNTQQKLQQGEEKAKREADKVS